MFFVFSFPKKGSVCLILQINKYNTFSAIPQYNRKINIKAVGTVPKIQTKSRISDKFDKLHTPIHDRSRFGFGICTLITCGWIR